jgi:putative peptidoglycan lipid II flippase
MSRMLKSTGAMAGATLISRVLGLVREMVYARLMGNGWVASAFLFAFMIPNLFRRLLGEGALTAAFVPVFKEREATEGEEGMWRSANAVISGLVVVTAGVVGLVMAGVGLALRWGEFREQTRLMLDLLWVMFPYMIPVCLAAVMMGMLNARGWFFVPALGATVLNVILIGSAVLWAPRMGDTLPEQVYALAYGVLAAGVAQALFQWPSLGASGWRYRWVTPWRDPSVREVVRRMIPAVLGVAAFQLNVVITLGFGYFVGDTVVASFQYAVRLMELPQGLFGASVATYLLPTLSGLLAERRWDGFRKTLLDGLNLLLVVNGLAAVLLFCLARPIVRLLFEGGLFQASATATVATALMCLAPGLLAFSGTNVLARAFYAAGDTRVPMQIGVFCLGVNTVLSLLLVLPLGAAGMALANTLTSTANVLLLGYALRRKFRTLSFVELGRVGLRVVAVMAGTGVVVLGVSGWWEQAVGGEGWGARLGAVAMPAGVGLAVYGVALWMAGVPAVRDIAGRLGAGWRRWKSR